METKFKKSEKLVPEQNISDRERINKVNDNNNCRLNNQTNGEDGLIPTELPLVYRQDNVLTVENGLNLSRRHELWGIQLLSGTMVALRSGATEDNVSSTAWRKVKEFAEKMTFNGKSGILPSKNALKKHWGNEEKEKFKATINLLKENDIAADGYWGCIWCFERYLPGKVCYFSLEIGCYGWDYENDTSSIDRVALIFK